MAAPIFVPPGSRVTTTSRPAAVSRAAKALTWVDLPAPSPPSKATKNPVLLVMSWNLPGPADGLPPPVSILRDHWSARRFAQ